VQQPEFEFGGTSDESIGPHRQAPSTRDPEQHASAGLSPQTYNVCIVSLISLVNHHVPAKELTEEAVPSSAMLILPRVVSHRPFPDMMT
jgi:hypothetical protein